MRACTRVCARASSYFSFSRSSRGFLGTKKLVEDCRLPRGTSPWQRDKFDIIARTILPIGHQFVFLFPAIFPSFFSFLLKEKNVKNPNARRRLAKMQNVESSPTLYARSRDRGEMIRWESSSTRSEVQRVTAINGNCARNRACERADR